MTHIDSFLDYLRFEKKYADLTIVSYASDLQQFHMFLFETYETKNMSEVNYPMIRQWIVGFIEMGLTHKTINRKLSTLKTFFKFLLKIQAIEVTPMAQHKSLKLPKRQQEVFSILELEKVSSYFEDVTFEGLRDHLIIELLYATGMRRQELIDLHLNSIDLKQKQLKVHGKRNKERLIPLLDSISNLVERYLLERSVLQAQGNQLFITSRGKPIYPNLVYRVVHSYFQKVSTKKKLSPHLLRHAFATHLLDKGADISAIKDLLGHSSLASTEVYTHMNYKELSKAHQAAHPRSQGDE
jgi:integrase/recombinase XerC